MRGFPRQLCALLLLVLLLTACTGGQEGSAAEEKVPQNGGAESQQAASLDAHAALKSISPAIPIYGDAQFRPDLTSRDAVMIRNQYGAGAEVFTLASDDSFPQVYHYYLTYLAQFRAFPAQNPYPPSQQNWRTFEVHLNQAMQDPFIPGDALSLHGKQLLLQLAETEAEPRTVIRYIVAPSLASVAPASPAPAVAAPPGVR